MHSAAPASASRRSAIGTVPAWPAMPVELRREPRGAAIAVTTPTGRFCCFQHRPLLDVQFDIGKQFAARPRRRTDMIGIEPELLPSPRASTCRRGRARRARFRRRCRRPRGCRAAWRQTARLPRRQSRSTSIANGSRMPAPVQIGDAGNRRDHPERPVPFAGVAHGVVMRAQHQARQPRPLAFVAAADIADGIETRGHAGSRIHDIRRSAAVRCSGDRNIRVRFPASRKSPRAGRSGLRFRRRALAHPISNALSARCARLACQCCAICSRVGTQTRSCFPM